MRDSGRQCTLRSALRESVNVSGESPEVVPALSPPGGTQSTLRPLPGYLELATGLVVAYADTLEGDRSVEGLLISVGRCPKCAAPLLSGVRVSVCSGCGHEVER